MIKKYECSSCGASIDFPDDAEKVTCEFCGTVHYRELSREERNKKSANETLDKLYDYKENFETYEENMERIRSTYSILKETEKNNKEFLPKSIIISVTLWLFICFISVNELQFINNYSKILFVVLLTVISSGVAIGLIFAVIFIKSKYDIRFEKNYNSAKKYYEDAKQISEEFLQEFDVNYIPNKYRDEETIDYLIDTIEDEKAYNLKQAINLFENKLEKDEEFEIRQQQIDELKELQEQNAELLKNSKNNNIVKGVIAGTAVTAGTVVAKKVAKEVIKNFLE